MENMSVMIMKDVLKRMPKALMCGLERMNEGAGKTLLKTMLKDLEEREKKDGLTATEKKAKLTFEQFLAFVHNER